MGGVAVPSKLNLTLSATLEPGDVLYIPRGFIHNASCDAEQGSIHLTLTVQSTLFSWNPFLLHSLLTSTHHLRATPAVLLVDACADVLNPV